MKLKLNVDIAQDNILDYTDSFLLIGSCFSQNMGLRMKELQFKAIVNPFGIVYNPISILKSLRRITDKHLFKAEELLEHNNLFHSMEHHGVFSGLNSVSVLEQINSQIEEANKCLGKKPTLVLTLGTAHVYTHIKTNHVVANCHKIPNSQFSKRRLELSEIEVALAEIRSLLPDSNIIYTLSPVRHAKDGLVENARSKAILLQAIHNQVDKDEKTYYFPAFEVMLDELRDYRFYKEDMLHPTQLAIDYIWQSFCSAYFNEKSRTFVDEAESLHKAMSHRSLYEGTEADIKFKADLKQRKQSHGIKWGV
jgi:hypothetical protein